ncbi:S8 family serine peptidase [Actinoplanes rectilineatus]|uniref:S8 family serine peptidase n=1 Tax=Actinoplanes rectilineatus TaxID=113571 RepID=UPI000B25B72E|nr:S8 family serine peptidase [Actinoplanes rectilineatus]
MRRKSTGLALSAALVLSGLTAGSPATATTGTPDGETGTTVTLITGDRVVLSGDAVSVHPGPGRDGIPMATSTSGGRTRVVPADALPLLRADRLDPRLFDVTGLIEAGYDDQRTELPLITSGTITATGDGRRKLRSLGATAVRTPKKDLAKLWKNRTATGKVWLDAKGEYTAADGAQQIGATIAWQQGLDGAGVTVGVVDSGVDVTHPDLAPVVTAQADFSTGTAVTGDIHDNVGHGTAVASILAGTGAASDGRYRGVAPGVDLVSAKIGDWDVTESSVIAAMEWTAGTQHATIVNMSLGFPNSPGTDPLEAAVEEMTGKYGTLFVVASGNDGINGNDPANGDDYDIGSPGDAPSALTVGAVDYQDRLADFSSRGPGLDGESIKPEITAPGVDIVHALSSDAGEGPYETGYGTSFASPHVAGAAAILAQKHPDWTPAQLKSALMGSARPTDGLGVYAQGAGRADIARALTTTLLADPPALNLTNDTGAEAVTYRNHGTTPLTVTLTVTAPFTVSTPTLTVPAGGTASATVTAPATLNAGAHSGRLTATTGTQTTTTPVGVVRKAPTVDLDLHVLGHDGQPTDDHYTQVIGLDTPYLYDSLAHYPWTADVSLTVPRGRYAIITSYFWETENGEWTSAVVAQPNVQAGTATDITVDTRTAQPVTLTVPDTTAQREAGAVDIAVHGPHGWYTYGANTYGGALRSAQLGPDGNATELVTVTRAALTADDGVYNVARAFPGTVPTGLTQTVTAATLATETGAMNRQATDSSDYMLASVQVAGYPADLAALSTTSAGTRRWSTADGVSWTNRMYEWREDGAYEVITTTGPSRRYQPGKTYTATFNTPVIAPCVPGTPGSWTGDNLRLTIAMACDGAGNPGTLVSGARTGGTTLYADGKQVATSDLPGTANFRVPAATGDYRLTVRDSRPAAFPTSTSTTVDWTFTKPAAVATLGTVRISPAGAGIAMTAPAGTKAVTLQVSYDDGATWRTSVARLHADGTWRAGVTRTGYASLRVTAKGAASTVTETIVRALPPVQ